MGKVAIGMIFFYQAFISPIIKQVFGDTCRYSPSCSEYTKQSIRKYGIINGIGLGSRQLFSCHPWAKVKNSPARNAPARNASRIEADGSQSDARYSLAPGDAGGKRKVQS